MSLKLRPVPFSPIDEDDSGLPSTNVTLVGVTKKVKMF